MNVAHGYTWLEEALANGGVVVTASRRLARALRTAFDEAQSDAGLDAWASPDIHSIHAWLVNLADQGLGTAHSYLRLGEHAAAQLWQQSLDEVARDPLPNRAGFVRHCVEAWSRCADWCVPLDDVMQYARSPDERLFARAAKVYAESLEAGQLLDAPGLAAAVRELVRGERIRVPDKLRFAGFDRLTPALQRLIDACITAGCDVALLETGERAADIRRCTFPDPNAELRAAGAWARGLLLQDPALRVGIVSSDLQNDAVATAHLVRDGFAPGWQYADPYFAAAVNVSYGQRLSDYPAIAFALTLLRWTCTPLT
ncbi:MAG: hypothetical protein KJO31_00795, partial [Gammaproteobacteria bacterium]|nr:hypothetical protein [Gammaproteobacteria bacterium]